MLVLLRRTSFLTTFYGLYHQLISNLLYFILRIGRALKIRTLPPTTDKHWDSRVSINYNLLCVSGLGRMSSPGSVPAFTATLHSCKFGGKKGSNWESREEARAESSSHEEGGKTGRQDWRKTENFDQRLPGQSTGSLKAGNLGIKNATNRKKIEWGSKYRTSLVFKWSKVVRSQNPPLIDCHMNTRLNLENRTIIWILVT